MTPRGWGGAKRGRELPAVKFPGTRLRGSCRVVVRGWGPAWNSRWGDPGGEIVGRLGAQILGSCAGLLAAQPLAVEPGWLRDSLVGYLGG